MMQEKILIADDEPYVLDVCKRILEKDYQVKIVHSGLEAIQVVQYEQFDLLLTDIKMPGIDGLETAREVKKINPDIVCITMTGFSTMETAIKALRLGVNEFVIKPFAPEELSMAIGRALEKERLRKENIRLKSLLPLFEFNKLLMSMVDTQPLLNQVLNLARTETKSDSAVLYIVDEENNFAKFTDLNMSVDDQNLLDTNGHLFLEHIEANPYQIPIEEAKELTPLLVKLNAKSVMIAPLLGKEKLLGILLLFKKKNRFSQSECNFLSVMTSQATVAYENARLFEDLQQAYDKLKTLDYMKSEFINVAAHELRTPLAILMGYASVVEEDIQDVHHKEYVAAIIRNAMRLRSLVDDLLNMRYIENGQLRLILTPVDLKALLTQVVHDMTMVAEEKGITIELQMSPDLPVISTDQQKFELVVSNLLANAIKFTPAQGKIWIDGHVDNNNIKVSVCDTGIGIPEQEFSRIFERFYQVENSLNREHDGIGLGLSIVKGIVNRFKGQIWVESILGEGSKFTFTVPIPPVEP